MRNLILNIRIWKIHFQLFEYINIKFIFKWYDFYIGVFIDTKKDIWYIFILPMIGIKVDGIRICINKTYKIKEKPFIHLFNWGNKYYPQKSNNNVKL